MENNHCIECGGGRSEGWRWRGSRVGFLHSGTATIVQSENLNQVAEHLAELVGGVSNK